MCKYLLILVLFLVLLIPKTVFSMDTVGTKLENARGAFVSGIYEHKIQGKSYIEKKFKDRTEFNNELKKVLALQGPLKKYMTEKTSDMPSFALYYNHGFNSIKYEKAAGESLWDFLIRAATAEMDLSKAGSHFYNDHTQSIMNNVRKVGYSIAKFHIWFKEPSDGNSFLTCIHGDMSPSNVFFNLYDGAVTFIDYSTFSWPEKKEATIDIDTLFNGYKAIGADLKYGIMEALDKKRLHGEAFNAEYANSLARLQQLKIAMAEGYNSALEEASIGFKLFEEKGKFFLKKVSNK